MNKFEKVSFQEFCKASKLEAFKLLSGKLVENEISLKIYNDIVMPKRKTNYSAGYDIHTPFEFILNPGDTIKISTGLKVYTDNGLWLMIIPRSSLGFKYRLQLDNTIGCIDEDYVDNSTNEGHIFIKMTNDGHDILVVNKGDAIAQAIFTPYFLTIDDEVNNIRSGGIGSTNQSINN